MKQEKADAKAEVKEKEPELKYLPMTASQILKTNVLLLEKVRWNFIIRVLLERDACPVFRWFPLVFTAHSIPTAYPIRQAVKTKDTRLLVGRVLRQTAGIRKTLEPATFKDFMNEALPSSSRAKSLASPLLDQVLTTPPLPSFISLQIHNSDQHCSLTFFGHCEM